MPMILITTDSYGEVTEVTTDIEDEHDVLLVAAQGISVLANDEVEWENG